VKNPHVITQILLLVLIGAVCWMGYQVGRLAAPAADVTPVAPVRPPAPAADAATLGKSYVPTLGATYGEAWQAASKAVAEGKSVADAQKVLQDTWRESRERAFAARVAPAFARVLPEGAEPATPEKRAEVARMFSDFGAGLKGGK
jgi:hypothetical protein